MGITMTLSTSTKALLDKIITDQEGGWVLSKDVDEGDGGWTYAGVTAKTFKELANLPNNLSYQDVVETLNNINPTILLAFKDEIYNIYESKFIPNRFEELPACIQGPLLSACINEGDKSGEEVLQETINTAHGGIFITVDGIIGDETIHQADCAHTEYLFKDFLYHWMRSYISICVSNPAKLQFLLGWHNRIEYWREQ